MEVVKQEVEEVVNNQFTVKDFTPGNGIIVVEYEEITERTRRGIIKGSKLMEEEKNELNKMFLKVVAVGEGCDNIQVGDRILPSRPIMEMPLKVSEGNKCGWVRKIDLVGVIKQTE